MEGVYDKMNELMMVCSRFWTFLCRNGRLFWADKPGRRLAILQAPIIAIFICLALYGVEQDCINSDESTEKAKNATLAVDNSKASSLKKINIALKALDKPVDKNTMSVSHAQSRATIFFVMI